MEGFRAKRQAIFIISLVLLILNICCMSEPETTSPMEISEREALYSAIQGFVGKWWNGSKLYPDLCGWTPIQHGHVGFMLSCYDAELSYDRHTDTFHGRYPPHGRRTIVIEEGIEWDRLRAAPVDTPPHNLHISDCLNDLRPGDHIEIQWRRNKEFPYDSWYGVVGYLESCDRNEIYCRCHTSVFSIGRI